MKGTIATYVVYLIAKYIAFLNEKHPQQEPILSSVFFFFEFDPRELFDGQTLRLDFPRSVWSMTCLFSTGANHLIR
jgi:hypothetical protein